MLTRTVKIKHFCECFRRQGNICFAAGSISVASTTTKRFGTDKLYLGAWKNG